MDEETDEPVFPGHGTLTAEQGESIPSNLSRTTGSGEKRHTGFRESSTRKPYSRISATRMDWHLSRAAKAA